MFVLKRVIISRDGNRNYIVNLTVLLNVTVSATTSLGQEPESVPVKHSGQYVYIGGNALEQSNTVTAFEAAQKILPVDLLPIHSCEDQLTSHRNNDKKSRYSFSKLKA